MLHHTDFNFPIPPPPSPGGIHFQSRGQTTLWRQSSISSFQFLRFLRMQTWKLETRDSMKHTGIRSSISHQICVCARDLKKLQFSGTLNPATPPPSLYLQFDEWIPKPGFFVKYQIRYLRRTLDPRLFPVAQTRAKFLSQTPRQTKATNYKILDFIVFPIVYIHSFEVIRQEQASRRTLKKEKKRTHLFDTVFPVKK